MDTLTGFPSQSSSDGGVAPSDTAEFEEVTPEDDAESTDPGLGSAAPPPEARVPSKHPPPPPTLRARAALHKSPRPLYVDGEPRFARDLMTRGILTIGQDDPILMLEEYMEAFRFRHLPVVDGDVLVGIIAYSDVLSALSSRLSKSAPEENVILHQLPAWRIMRSDFVAVRPTEPLERVAELLWETRGGCVPVTEEDGTLVGIITEGDFVRLTHHFLMAV
jgi:CBS domain-containing membrane protein